MRVSAAGRARTVQACPGRSRSFERTVSTGRDAIRMMNDGNLYNEDVRAIANCVD